MESLPKLIFGRELGFRRDTVRFTDDRQHLYTVKCLDTDIARVAENEENLFDEIPIYDIKFCPGHFHPNFVAVTDELGFVTIVDVHPKLEGEDKIILKEQCHENALFSVDWSPHVDGVLATCSGDQTVKVWDIKKDFACTASLVGHGRSVKSVRFHPTNPNLILSGGRDGAIRLWDVRDGRVAVNVIPLAHGKNKDEPVSITDALFQDEHAIVSCGSKDGAIRLWDYRKTYCGYKKISPVSKFQCKDYTHGVQGFHSMCLDNHNNLYASTFHEVLKFNLSSEKGQTDPAHFIAPDAFNSYIKINTSFDGRFLISGSSTAETYVWDTWYDKYEPFLVLKCSSEGTTGSSCVASFSPQDNLTIVSGNDEGQIHIWRPYFGPETTEGDPLERRKFVSVAQTLSEADLVDVSAHIDRCRLGTCRANSREAEISKLRGQGCYNRRKSMSFGNVPVASKDFNLSSLLKDLPNFVMDGTHPRIIDTTVKSTVTRKPCWLEGMQLAANGTSLANFNTTTSVKRPAAAMLASRDLNSQLAPQPKKLKLKLKPQKTPKRIHRCSLQSTRTPSTPAGRRARKCSTDTTTTKSPSSQNILKYFCTLPTPLTPKDSLELP